MNLTDYPETCRSENEGQIWKKKKRVVIFEFSRVGKEQRREYKELSSKWAPRTDENEVTLTEDVEDIKHRWKEYIKKQNKQTNKKHTILKTTMQTYNRGREQDEPPPLRSEVERALQQIRNGKLPGAYDIPAEFWKA